MDISSLKISIIGAGNMGSAITRGLIAGTLIHSSNIKVSDIEEQLLNSLKESSPEISINTSNSEIVLNADIIILAVKPWLVEKVATEISNHINYNHQMIVSIAAGIDFNTLKSLFAENACMFRLIPNTAIDVLESVSTLASYNATATQIQILNKMFSELGKVFIVQEEQLNAYMSLSSCGIAYAFRYIRASMEGGVEMGISPQTAKEVVLQTLRGAIELLESNNTHPEVEIDKVTTPGGITIKGLNEMEASGFTNAVIKGLKASHIN